MKSDYFRHDIMITCKILVDFKLLIIKMQIKGWFIAYFCLLSVSSHTLTILPGSINPMCCHTQQATSIFYYPRICCKDHILYWSEHLCNGLFHLLVHLNCPWLDHLCTWVWHTKRAMTSFILSGARPCKGHFFGGWIFNCPAAPSVIINC